MPQSFFFCSVGSEWEIEVWNVANQYRSWFLLLKMLFSLIGIMLLIVIPILLCVCIDIVPTEMIFTFYCIYLFSCFAVQKFPFFKNSSHWIICPFFCTENEGEGEQVIRVGEIKIGTVSWDNSFVLIAVVFMWLFL